MVNSSPGSAPKPFARGGLLRAERHRGGPQLGYRAGGRAQARVLGEFLGVAAVCFFAPGFWGRRSIGLEGCSGSLGLSIFILPFGGFWVAVILFFSFFLDRVLFFA